MKYSVITAAVLSFLVMALTPSSSFAAEHKGLYVELKPGAYFPAGNLNDDGFDTVFTGGIAVGGYLNRNLAIEGEVGYFQTSSSQNGIDNALSVLPVTASLKAVLPFRGGEFSLGGGIGVYFASVDTKVNGSSQDDSGAAFGGHGLVGLSIDITPTIFVGAEGRYIFTTKADLYNTKENMDGGIVSGVLGFRF
jgi:opacity protein-like surface antigen